MWIEFLSNGIVTTVLHSLCFETFYVRESYNINICVIISYDLFISLHLLWNCYSFRKYSEARKNIKIFALFDMSSWSVKDGGRPSRQSMFVFDIYYSISEISIYNSMDMFAQLLIDSKGCYDCRWFKPYVHSFRNLNQKCSLQKKTIENFIVTAQWNYTPPAVSFHCHCQMKWLWSTNFYIQKCDRLSHLCNSI